MNKALLYLIWRSYISGSKHKLKRLKQPKYFIPAVFGVLYFGLMFLPMLLDGRDSSETLGIHLVFRDAVPVLMGIFIGIMWAFDFQQGGLNFNETEAEVFLAAPLSRRELIIFCILKNQMQLLFTSVLMTVLMTISLGPPNLLIFAITLFAVFNLYKGLALAIALTWSALKTKWYHWPVRLVVPIPCIGASLILAWHLMVSLNNNLPEPALFGIDLPIELTLPLLPLKAIGHALFANSFAIAAPGMIAAICLGALFFIWAVQMDVALEENTLALAKKKMDQIRKVQRMDNVAKPTKERKKTWPKLSPNGPIWRALMWKNMVALVRNGGVRGLGMIFGSIVLVQIGCTILDFPIIAKVMAIMLMPIIILLPFLGPPVFRTDFRGELEQLELVKTFPIPARDMFFVQVGLTTVITAVLQLGLTFIVLMTASTINEEMSVNPWLIGATAITILPAVSWAAITTENALMLWLPAWFIIKLQKDGKGGIEFLGRGMMSIFARTLGMGILFLIPGCAAFVVVFLFKIWIGWWSIPLASALFSMMLFVETILIGGNVADLYHKLEPGSDELT